MWFVMKEYNFCRRVDNVEEGGVGKNKRVLAFSLCKYVYIIFVTNFASQWKELLLPVVVVTD
jgi:hypothetical protein